VRCIVIHIRFIIYTQRGHFVVNNLICRKYTRNIVDGILRPTLLTQELCSLHGFLWNMYGDAMTWERVWDPAVHAAGSYIHADANKQLSLNRMWSVDILLMLPTVDILLMLPTALYSVDLQYSFLLNNCFDVIYLYRVSRVKPT